MIGAFMSKIDRPINKITVKCVICGNEFLAWPYEVKSGTRKYCSRSCSSKSKTGNRGSNWQGGKIERTCRRCGKKFKIFKGEVKEQGNYCSHECQRGFPNVKLKCHQCGKEFVRCFSLLNKNNFCSQECYQQAQIGNVSPAWNGGRTIDNGYICIWIPEHPNSDSKGYVREHRLVMEEKIGRYLKRSEVVHHIDGDTMNNDIDNLILFKSQSEHSIYHAKERRKQKEASL